MGKDVAKVLGHSNPQKALRDHVDEEDSRGERIVTPSGIQTTKVINESGLYSLILSSKLPTAKKFKRWVTSVVLPSIRKHGMFATEKTIDQMLEDPDSMIRVLTEMK
ncbi:BRO-N domain-containing protein, partial [Actinotignum schaalii]|uniref:BRO-N domain-containing protein n=1 Tax=Actinotignum schaalii TaxID=59505 RepID=UPI00254DBB60|nr:Bro-N domain-containing protein [Actinotignum schaalii]